MLSFEPYYLRETSTYLATGEIFIVRDITFDQDSKFLKQGKQH